MDQDLHRLGREVRLSEICRTWQDERLDLRQTVQSVLAEAQVILDDLFRRQAKPLSDGDIVVGGGLKDLYSIEGSVKKC